MGSDRVPAEVWGLPAKLRDDAARFDPTRADCYRACADELEAALKSVPREQALRFQVTEAEWHRVWGDGSYVQAREMLNAELAKRPAEPAPRLHPMRELGHMRLLGVDIRPDGPGCYRADFGGGFASGDLEHIVGRIVEHVTGWYETADGGAVTRRAEPEPRALPTREELAERMHDAFREMRSGCEFPPKPWGELCGGMQDGYRFVADRLLPWLREHASVSGDVEALRIARLERDELREAVAKLEEVIAENKRKADDHRRQRDEAREELAELQSVVDGLHAQLAARPEPVVIDEALAERIFREYYGKHGGKAGEMALLCALRDVFGDRVSVAGPAGEHTASYVESLKRERNEWEAARNADCARANAAERECAKLRAELQAAQAELENERKNLAAVDHDRRVYIDRLQALMDLVEVHPSDREANDCVNMLVYGNRVRDGARAVLQPATPEPRTDNATVTPGHQYATRADVERVEAALRHFLFTYSGLGAGHAAAEALAMLDARKQEGGGA